MKQKLGERSSDPVLNNEVNITFEAFAHTEVSLQLRAINANSFYSGVMKYLACFIESQEDPERAMEQLKVGVDFYRNEFRNHPETFPMERKPT